MHALRHPARGHSSYKGPKLTDTVEEIVGKDHGDLRPSGRAEEGAASGACGGPDHVLVDIADRAAPKLVEHCERIKRPPRSDRLLHEARTHRPDCRRAGIGV